MEECILFSAIISFLKKNAMMLGTLLEKGARILNILETRPI